MRRNSILRWGLAGLLSLALFPTVSALMDSAIAAEVAQLKPGATAPGFTLPDTEGNTHTLADYLAQDKVVVLEWFNPDCPYVKKYHEGNTNNSMREAYAYATEHGMAWLAINSGAPGKQGNGVERNGKAIEDYRISYPVLLDESGAVGMSYAAQNTPQIFVVVDGKVVYNGGVDDTKTADQAPSTMFLLDALKEIATGKPITNAETMHPGCGVKYAD